MSVHDRVDAYLHITPRQLAACMPGCPNPVEWARAFDDAIEFFDVRDVAMLMAQVGHESADLTRLEESLYYTMGRLREVWPSRFPDAASTGGYARNPEALANQVYANRMGNGSPSSGDGWKRRGMGPIQLTGDSNHKRFSDAINDRTPYDNPELLKQPTYGALSACWFYVTHVPNGADIILATRRINGGHHGLADRKRRYERCLKVLS
jgi:putative chitinase